MQGAQKGVDYEDDTQFEIADFRDTLNKCIEDEDKIYGRKNKPRNQDPSMYEILSWQDKDDALWDYTKKDMSTVQASVANQLKYKINKAHSPWVTENMDQFRKFTYSPSKKVGFYDLEEPSKTKPSATKSTISKELAEQLGKSPKDQNVYVRDLPAKASETIDKYSIQELKHLKDVLKVIENRAISKGGEVIKNPIAHQLTDHYGYQDEFDREYGLNVNSNGEEYEQKGSDEEEEEDIKVEKADYSNVQSRLLTKKVRKAKELDPVYEKDRLQRREERIQRLNETTRWLPNSAFKTYFGKAPFENYGRGNLNPTVGGPIYGDYMKSHNVNPHAGGNRPEYKQIYGHAELAATRNPDSQPEPPRKCKDEIRLSQKQVDDLKRRNPRVPEKFEDKSQKIIKPDLVNSLRFASEENTPDNSFDAGTKPRKNLGESLKQLSKKTRAIRKENVKNSPTEIAREKTKSEQKAKRQEKVLREEPVRQEPVRQEPPKTKSAKKEAPSQQENRRSQPQSESKQVKAQSRTSERGNSRPKNTNEYDIADEFDFTGKDAKNAQQAPQKGRANESRGVRELLNDPPTAFQERPKSRGKVEVEKSPKGKKEVTFKQGSENKSAAKFKEAPVAPQAHKEAHDFGKVEELQTLLKETQKNDKLWNKVNEDMNGTLSVNPMSPPKNYLFSLAQKETDPRYYKNVPAVWLNRIPYAGKKSEKCDDIKGVFNAAE